MESYYTETEKQFYALLLAAGLFFVIIKVAYEYFANEKFTLFHVFHPIKPIGAKERQFISQFLKPFHDFNPEQRRQFLKRFAWFKSKKRFIFYGDIQNKEEIRAYVAASAILVTMGMRNFKYQNSVSRIVVYPSKYCSRISRKHHIGEYNPRLKTLVFSAEDLKEGYGIPNDGVNLGIHEVTHALMIETRKKSTWEAMRFKVGLMRLKNQYETAHFQDKLKSSTLFREYAQSNFVEYFAVLVEVFFEQPIALKQEYPGVYQYVGKMLNYP
ncbi:zinc-dependent peptidase [Croceivirga thetidis]|uniref:Zinc-dependent peptidase n=1 Tax=Croceivirga thetidis TaxID=2721623 RepID=A0ABX1GTA2_9FLAO|nr:zinc-dependent peptidase [Croceivirga thetidis]NKI33188.1 zinc-dependent peptidase [Croceivirga thetidis]